MAPDQDAGAVALDFQLERFAIAFAAANLRVLAHQLEDLYEDFRCFLDLLVEIGRSAIRVAKVLPRFGGGLRRQILRLRFLRVLAPRRTRALLLALGTRLARRPWRLRGARGRRFRLGLLR